MFHLWLIAMYKAVLYHTGVAVLLILHSPKHRCQHNELLDRFSADVDTVKRDGKKAARVHKFHSHNIIIV